MVSSPFISRLWFCFGCWANRLRNILQEADTSFVDTEMDEMMVQDAGILSEVQEEITLGGAEDVSSQFTISLPTHAPVGAASPPKDLVATAGTTTTKTGEEIELSAGKKRGRKPKSAAKSDVDLSVAASRRGRSAVIAKKEEVEEEEACSGQTEVAPPALVVEEGRRTRSSGRNPRPKKFDPDFCYDESVAFAGGRKRTGSVKSGVSSSTPKSTKSVVLISKAPLADDPSSSCVAKASSEAQVDTDKYFFPGSPAADDEAKETGGAPGVALADDVMGPSVLSAQQTAVPQKKPGNFSHLLLPLLQQTNNFVSQLWSVKCTRHAPETPQIRLKCFYFTKSAVLTAWLVPVSDRIFFNLLPNLRKINFYSAT
jgi:hypothetical protein